MIRARTLVGLLLFACVGSGRDGARPAAAADLPAVVVEPTDLTRRPELVGREVIVDDRIRYFLESRKGQGFDQLVLKRTDVPFFLPPKIRYSRPPSEPNAVVQGTLKVVDGRLVGEVLTLELLAGDAERLDREVARTRPDDFAAKRTWALWAERRGRELNDPKLAARGVTLEGDALWAEASRPGADPIALADGSLDRPIAPSLRNALYHRGFRAAEAQASTIAAVDDLARRVRAALPHAADPNPAAALRPESTDPDPAIAYRAATPEEQGRMERRLYADLVEKAFLLRLQADPSQAPALIDEATRTLADRPAVADQLRQRGLAAAERGVANMRQSEVEDLARRFRDGGQEDRARRALGDWLGDRRKNRLSATDAEGRVLLAANYEKMLGDRATAGALLAEAAAIDPESRSVADAFLRLGFRKGEAGWFDPSGPKPAAEPRSGSAGSPTRDADRGDSLRGLTRAQTRSRMGGKPDRTVRVATQGQIVEQWVYRTGKSEQIIVFRVDSATTEPRVTASYSVAQ